MKTIIIDDERGGINTLRKLLGKHCPEVDIVAIAQSAQLGSDAICTHRPDLVFLDIEMPGFNGFDMLEQHDEINFEVIFTTAYDKYAIKAFRFSALDYLLKPIEYSELIEAVQKARQKLQNKMPRVNYKKRLDNVRLSSSGIYKLAVSTMESVVFVELNNIVYLAADINYTYIYLADCTHLIMSKTLKDFEEMLQGHGFLRVHKSYLINLRHVKKYVKGEGGYVVMSNTASIEVSQRKRSALLEALEAM